MTEFYDVSESYGKYVFDETVMRERLPKAVLKRLKKRWMTEKNWNFR